MNKEEIKVMTKDCVYSEDGITYMSDKQYNNYIDIIKQLQQENKKYKEAFGKAKEIIMQPNIEIREYRSCDMDYVCINEQLLEILNEVNR